MSNICLALYCKVNIDAHISKLCTWNAAFSIFSLSLKEKRRLTAVLHVIQGMFVRLLFHWNMLLFSVAMEGMRCMLYALHVATNEEEQSEKRRIGEKEDRGWARERAREGTYHSNCPKVFHCICIVRKWAQISQKKCLAYDVCLFVSVNLIYFSNICIYYGFSTKGLGFSCISVKISQLEYLTLKKGKNIFFSGEKHNRQV